MLRTLTLGLTLGLLALCGCQAPDSTTDTADGGFVVPDGAVDLRQDFEDPDWDDAVVFRSTPLVIEPYSETQYCLYLTWTGETSGITKQVTYQTDFGHHFVIASTSASEREFPDGTVIDCTEADASGMEDFEPFLVGGTLADANHRGLLVLPDGMASRIREGQRLILQSHYVNTSADTIVVQDELQLEMIAEDAVEVWTAPWVHTEVDLDIQPGVSSIDVTCTWEGDYTMLFLGGHMHEWGKQYAVTFDDGVDAPETIYAIDDWEPDMRDAPLYTEYEPGELVVKEGDIFTTTCTWDNDTGGSLGFPQEMCATFGMAYPARAAIICEP
jgi:hypothetical protein